MDVGLVEDLIMSEIALKRRLKHNQSMNKPLLEIWAEAIGFMQL